LELVTQHVICSAILTARVFISIQLNDISLTFTVSIFWGFDVPRSLCKPLSDLFVALADDHHAENHPKIKNGHGTRGLVKRFEPHAGGDVRPLPKFLMHEHLTLLMLYFDVVQRHAQLSLNQATATSHVCHSSTIPSNHDLQPFGHMQPWNTFGSGGENKEPSPKVRELHDMWRLGSIRQTSIIEKILAQK
ncbi:MAG: hypothetical protein Q9183_004339, partial [Haloplaca sp. 2 TL-2023]